MDEFKLLRHGLALEPHQVLAVPGNHDIVRYPKESKIDLADLVIDNQTRYQHENEFRLFVDDLNGRRSNDPLNYVQRVTLRYADLLICVLNSCTILATEWTEYGYVGTSGMDAIAKLAEQLVARPTFKLMALHHHLIPVTDVKAPNSKGVTLTLDASALLDAAQRAGVHIAVHGHEHMPRLMEYKTLMPIDGGQHERLHIVSSGSASVADARRPGSERNTYCVFEFKEDRLHLRIREIRPDGREGSSLYDQRLGIAPVTP